MNNFISGLIIGIVTGFVGNWLFDRYKRIRRGKKPFVSTEVFGGVITFEGQMVNSTTAQTAIIKLIHNVDPNVN